MRYLLSTTVWLLVSLAVAAAEPAKPNTLTPKESADGWLLLFDGATTFGWKTQGQVEVKDGVLALGGDQESRAQLTTFLKDCEIQFEFATTEGTESPNCLLVSEDRGKWQMSLHARQAGWHSAAVTLEFTRSPSSFQAEGTVRTLSGVTLSKTGGQGYNWSTPRALTFQTPAGSTLHVRNLKLRPLKTRPIFNGKDLSGWKEFPGKKSKFTVTPEGWLHIKNGPGDLQTEGQWGDFVLQVDCLSNGDRLNSGVFFRCRTGEYQNGYEAQIHNGFTAQPIKEYTLEEYDPATHRLVGKKKVKYQASDYGTGGIYRRQPARFQAAKDHEWFTMTVVARGRHLAVWVNGLQVTDWTDNRPPSDNARTGCRLEKGPLSLQGHDPTTDLSFRNIRVVELPKTADVK